MGVYIRGMEMPKSCHDCEMSALVDVSDGLAYGCQALKEMIFNDRERLPNCPLVPVQSHGDLIDRGPFIEFIQTHWDGYDQWFVGQLEARPTIIPAEEGETCILM